jgi:hypothetical protein
MDGDWGVIEQEQQSDRLKDCRKVVKCAENGIPMYNKEIIVSVAFHISNPPSQGGNVQIIQKQLAVLCRHCFFML